MLCSIADWTRGSRLRSWAPFACMSLTATALSLTIILCYSVFDADDDNPCDVKGDSVDDGGSHPPAISALGAKGTGHNLFAAGFFFTAVCLCCVLVFRAAQLASTLPQSKSACLVANVVALLCGLAGLPAILTMAFVSMCERGSNSHIIGAGVGMAALAVYGLLHGALCVVVTRGDNGCGVDASLSTGVRLAAGCWEVATAVLGMLMFGIWLTDQTVTELEWAGVVFVFVSFLPHFLLLWHYDCDGNAGAVAGCGDGGGAVTAFQPPVPVPVACDV